MRKLLYAGMALALLMILLVRGVESTAPTGGKKPSASAVDPAIANMGK